MNEFLFANIYNYLLSYYVNDITKENVQVAMEYGRNDTELKSYIYGNERIGFKNLGTGKNTSYLYNAQGSVAQTVSGGQIEQNLIYDDYGNISQGADINFVGFGFDGEEQNTLTGLTYLRARYLDNASGSFVSADSYSGELANPITQNVYTFANADPVNNVDPSGHYALDTRMIDKYANASGRNELRDYMVEAALRCGEINAQNAFNGYVARAANTSFMNYQSISFIPQSVADYHIDRGIEYAGEVSTNYGCDVPTVPDESIERFTNNVNRAKDRANSQIGSIKASKKRQFDEYQEYLAMIDRILKLMQDEIGRGLGSDESISSFPFDSLLQFISRGADTIISSLVYMLTHDGQAIFTGLKMASNVSKSLIAISTLYKIGIDSYENYLNNSDPRRYLTDAVVDLVYIGGSNLVGPIVGGVAGLFGANVPGGLIGTVAGAIATPFIDYWWVTPDADGNSPEEFVKQYVY
ncbi:MAG: RHS repeat-associated core domain-containing protein [Coriobacteriales bacterium]|nr:RHS repeat-associated core domain-containing protein [Coriobacteriales bacterium]